MAVSLTMSAIRSGYCLKWGKDHPWTVITMVLFFFVAGAYVASIGFSIFLSSRMATPEFTGVDVTTMPGGALLLKANFTVERNDRCHLDGSHALVFFTPPQHLDKQPLGTTQSREGDVSLTSEDLTIWLEAPAIPGHDWAGWRYSWQMWYVCKPLGLIHWSYAGNTVPLP
jgi:hypothetical protein